MQSCAEMNTLQLQHKNECLLRIQLVLCIYEFGLFMHSKQIEDGKKISVLLYNFSIGLGCFNEKMRKCLCGERGGC